MVTGAILLGFGDEVGYVIGRWTLAADVGDETLRAADASLMEHLGEFVARSADEGFTTGFLLKSWGFPHYHDLSRDRAGWTDLDGHDYTSRSGSSIN
jgi:hypothetical protein